MDEGKGQHVISPLSLYFSICLSLYLSIYLCISLSISLSPYICISPSIDLSIHLSIFVSLHLSVNLFIYPSIPLSIHFFGFPSLYLVCLCLSLVFLSSCLFFVEFSPGIKKVPNLQRLVGHMGRAVCITGANAQRAQRAQRAERAQRTCEGARGEQVTPRHGSARSM